MKYIIITLIFLLPAFSSFSQDSLTFTPDDVPGLTILNRKYFTGSNLWGHIDGAADLFLEYGFRDLRYYQLDVKGTKLDVEIYRFQNPYESLGIYSVKKFGCLQEDSTLNPMFCKTRYALSFPVSDFYVTIAGSHGTSEEQEAERRIADALYAKPENKGLTMKDIYPPSTGDFTFTDYKIIMGPLGFQNGLPDWSTRFGDYNGYVCIWYSVRKGDKDIDVFLFNFKSPAQIERMLRENGWRMTAEEMTIEGTANWLIARRGDMLMILTGEVSVDVLRQLKTME